MNKRVSRKAKRRIVLISFCLVFSVFALFASVFDDWLTILSNQKDAIKLEQEYKELLKEETSLKSEVIKLQDPEYVARYARETYFYSLPDEIIIKLD